MPRLFIAISVPDEYKTRLDTMVASLGGRLRSRVRWTLPANWHVTLHFLGQVEEEMVGEIRDALRRIEFSVFSMRADGVEGIPNVFQPRVIWLAMDEGGEVCIALAEAVKDVMDAFGFKRGNQCRPHLTLGLVKRLECDDFEAAFAEVLQGWPMVQVEKFSLLESELTPDGSIYTVVEEFPLRAKS